MWNNVGNSANNYDNEEIEENVAPNFYKKVYYSDILDSPIINAITGEKYPYKVGSKDETRFFKVKSTTAYKNRSAKLQYPANASTTNQAFYENPEQYMRHQNVKLSNDIVFNWNNNKYE